MRKLIALVALTLVAGSIQTGHILAANASNSTQSVSGGGVTVKVTHMNPRSNEDTCF
ncbi:MAG: hypothetical protein OEN50_18565 [Deltaproteobacteria bacterium]|nr:hypothetical protein [Deltaproteobacteria bacterium]